MNQSPVLATQQKRHAGALTLTSYLDATWELPAFYAPVAERSNAISAEYAAMVDPDGVAISDRSWLACLELRGRDRQTFLQGMISNEVASLTPGQGCRAAMLSTNGQILADLSIYALDDRLIVVTDPRCLGRVEETLDKFLISEDVNIANLTGKYAVVALNGGGAAAFIQEAFGVEVSEPYGNGVVRDGIMVFRSGLRGLASYDLWIPADVAPAFWDELLDAGARPVGMEATEVARVEAGDPAWGAELESTVLFPEVELGEAISYRKGCYVGQEIIARIRARGHTNRSLRGILFEPGNHSLQPGDLLYPDPDFDDLDADREIGRITSAAISPRFGGRLLALGYVRREHVTAGSPVICRYAHREAHGVVMVPPFLNTESLD